MVSAQFYKDCTQDGYNILNPFPFPFPYPCRWVLFKLATLKSL